MDSDMLMIRDLAPLLEEDPGIKTVFDSVNVWVIYPLVNQLVDPENHQLLMETSLPTLMTAAIWIQVGPSTYHLEVFEV